VGVFVNAQVSVREFGVLLAVLVMLVGVTVLVREQLGNRPGPANRHGPEGIGAQAAIGGFAAIVSGMFGLGGPMIAVPVMIVAGLPILTALAAAQAQSVIVATTGTFTYLSQGAISWPLAVLTGIPELVGVWLGWKVAHKVPRRQLTCVLGVSLIVLGPVLAINR
jgi:uncharacterized membrane protein YfcA